MTRSAGSLPQQILWFLADVRRRHPEAPYREPRQIFDALKKAAFSAPGDARVQPARGAFDAALTRLRADHLVQRRTGGRTSRYAITARGLREIESTQNPRPWREGTVVATHHASYRIVRQLRPHGRPASARVEVFQALVERVNMPRPHPRLTANAPVVIKTVPNHQLDHLLEADANDRSRYFSELNDAFAAETQKLEAAPPLSSVAATLDWGRETRSIAWHRPVDVPFVVQEYIEGPDLAAHLRSGLESGFTGMANVADWFDLAQRLSEGVKEVQAAGTFHRHIWPGTILVGRNGPVFVDLMEAVFHVPAWPAHVRSEPDADRERPQPGVESTGERLQEELFVAPEWRGNLLREPRRTADLYSLGAVLYFAATGAPPQFDVTDREALKKSVARSLQGSIGAENYGVADIISRCLRVTVPQRVADAYTMLTDIRTFRESPRRFSDQKAIQLLNRVNRLFASEAEGVFASLAGVELEQFERVVDELEARSVTIRGGHDDFVLKLCSYLSTLGAGDEYWAVTVPDFWMPWNLGIQGRYLSMNAEIIRRGAIVKRVFLMTDEDLRDPHVIAIVDAHRDLERDLAAKGDKVKGLLDVRYRRMTGRERRASVDEGHVGLWVRGDSLVQVRALYNSKGLINRMTMSKLSGGQRAARKRDWFDPFFEGPHVRPLREWGTD